MKNILKMVIPCLLSAHIQASIDYLSSMVIAPRIGATIQTSTPVIIGMVLNQQQKPIKNKAVTIFVDNRKVAVVPSNNHGVWSYALPNSHALNNGFHYVEACVALSPNNFSWTKGSFFLVQANRTHQLKSGNVNAANSAINFPFEGAYTNTTTPIVVGSLLNSSFQAVAGETVNVKIDSSTVGSPTSDSNGVFSYELTSGLSEAAHTVGAHCVESSVDLTTNNFVVDVTAPAAPTISSPTQNETVTSNPVVISGTTEADATVTTFMDGDVYGDISYADGSGNWSIEYELDNDTHSVTATACDLAFNTSSMSAARDFTVNA